MDLPNVTLFVQIINFYIAYRVLYVFVFDPALKILVAQDLQKDSVEKQIDQALVEYDQVMIKQKNNWKAMKNRLYLLMPEKISTCFLTKNPVNIEIKSTESLSPQQKTEIVTKLGQELLDIK